MNQQQKPSNFEERLREYLRAVVAERGAEGTEPVGSAPTWRRALRPALAGAGVATVAGAVLLVLAGGNDTSAAYAVEPQDGGQVRVEIRSLEDAQGLQDALDEAGVPANVNYVPAGTVCREPRFKPVDPEGQEAGVEGQEAVEAQEAMPAGEPSSPPAADGESSLPTKSLNLGLSQAGEPAAKTVFTVSPETVGTGQTLVLTVAPEPGGEGETVQAAVAEGDVAPCVQVPAGQATLPTETKPPTPTEGGATEGGLSKGGQVEEAVPQKGLSRRGG
ncbi:MAG: hypothetical protein JSS97_07240 [Actinobacteria bacterium]|nr:hypothetical protein [Actinomycetota bacterium]